MTSAALPMTPLARRLSCEEQCANAVEPLRRPSLRNQLGELVRCRFGNTEPETLKFVLELHGSKQGCVN